MLALGLGLALATTTLAACGDDDDDDGGGGPSASQLPPTGATALATWLAGGAYLDWHCEAAGHAARASSPHGRNRICNNDAIHDTASGAFPVGAASVKELLDDGDRVIGYAVYRKDAAGTDGASWYWYEDMNGQVVADGAGNAGVPKTVCVDCHAHAERDFVFTIAP